MNIFDVDSSASYARFEADMEFQRARLRTLARSIFKSKNRKVGTAGLTADSQTLVPIDSIVGTIDREGRAIRGFPRIRGKLAVQWRRDWLDPEAGGTPFTVQPGPGGWYLMGGVSANVLLETLKSKKRPSVLVIRWNQKVLDVGCSALPCEDQERIPEGSSGRAAS